MFFLNVDDYTRITTPRQDVLFKKGYLSRPKSYAPTTEPIETSPADDVAMITIEEAIAAGLVHGYDPENPFLGYYDAHGVFYVNRKPLTTIYKVSININNNIHSLHYECC